MGRRSCTLLDALSAFFLLLLLCGAAVTVLVPSSRAALWVLVEWMREHPEKGLPAYTLFFAVGAVLCFPQVLLAAVGGFVFPLGWAALAVWTGTVLGSTAAFMCGRLLLRSQIRRCLDSGERRGFRGRGAAALHKLDVALRQSSQSPVPGADHDWGPLILVVLIRLPYIPLVAVNYLLSATDSLPLCTYMGATALGVIPGSVFYTYMGVGVENIQAYINGEGGADSAAAMELTIAGWVAVIIGFAATWRYARRRLANMDDLETEEHVSGEEEAGEHDETTAASAMPQLSSCGAHIVDCETLKVTC